MNRADEFRGRAAFVTGGASGIGLGIARTCARNGMTVALADIDEVALHSAAASLTAEGATITAVNLDVSDPRNWSVALDKAESTLGPLAILASNAGVAGSRLPLEETPAEAWRWSMGINLDGCFNAIQAGVPRLRSSGKAAHFVATASLGAFLVQPANGVYSAAKAGVIALCEAPQAELSETDIGVSVLCPGLVRSRLLEDNAKRAPSGVPIGEEEPELKAALAASLDPAQVGELVWDGIDRRRFWVFTHPELRDLLAARTAAIAAAMAAP